MAAAHLQRADSPDASPLMFSQNGWAKANPLNMHAHGVVDAARQRTCALCMIKPSGSYVAAETHVTGQ
jgi:hypothetical protein